MAISENRQAAARECYSVIFERLLSLLEGVRPENPELREVQEPEAVRLQLAELTARKRSEGSVKKASSVERSHLGNEIFRLVGAFPGLLKDPVTSVQSKESGGADCHIRMSIGGEEKSVSAFGTSKKLARHAARALMYPLIIEAIEKSGMNPRERVPSWYLSVVNNFVSQTPGFSLQWNDLPATGKFEFPCSADLTLPSGDIISSPEIVGRATSFVHCEIGRVFFRELRERGILQDTARFEFDFASSKAPNAISKLHQFAQTFGLQPPTSHIGSREGEFTPVTVLFDPMGDGSKPLSFRALQKNARESIGVAAELVVAEVTRLLTEGKLDLVLDRKRPAELKKATIPPPEKDGARP